MEVSGQPFAWEAREFLRKKLVGREVSFQIEYTIPNTGREFGTVFVNGENITLALLRAGLVRVRENRSGKYGWLALVLFGVARDGTGC